MRDNTAIDRAHDAIVLKGEQLSAKQIAARFGVVNPYHTVYSLRREGYPINLERFTDNKGNVTKKYSLGNPSRQIIAAGYKAVAASRA